MPFRIVRNDITKMQADAIVNTANREPGYGSGIDFAIYRAAGEEELLAERKKIGLMQSGTSAVTPAFRLSAKYIIHTVGTPWVDGKSGEEATLRACYRSVFALATEKKVESLAVPLLASGSFGYPKGIALRVALSEIEAFLKTSDMDISLVVFDKKSFELSEELYGDVSAYISERYAEEKHNEEHFFAKRRRRSFFENRLEACECYAEQAIEAMPKAESLEDVILKKGKTFIELLTFYEDQRGLTDAQLQNRANVDRRTFSKIRCGKTKIPSKATIFAFAIALELNLDEAKDLLASAGLAFSPSELTDLIVQYFIERGRYDMGEVNAVLFEYDQPSLGALAKVS